jgi:cytoskeletal protein CcmA (bactofilin family)
MQSYGTHDAASFATPPLADNIASLPNVSKTSSSKDMLIPHTESPLEVTALLDRLNVSFTIGEGDEVAGSIKLSDSKCIVVRGTVRGDIECSGMVVLMKGGRVEGNIKAGQVWIEGDVAPTQSGTQAKIDAGTLHIGTNARVIADCVFDQISISTPNRGVRGALESRSTSEGDGTNA